MQGLITNLEAGKLALYYYKSAEIARIFASSEYYSEWAQSKRIISLGHV